MHWKKDYDTNKTCKQKQIIDGVHMSVPSTYLTSRWLLGFHVLVHSRPCTNQSNLGTSKSSSLTRSFTNQDNPENDWICKHVYMYIHICPSKHPSLSIQQSIYLVYQMGKNKHQYIPEIPLLLLPLKPVIHQPSPCHFR